MPPDPAVLRGLMKENYDEKHGGVKLAELEEALTSIGRRPIREFEALLKEPSLGMDMYGYCALEGLRSAAYRGELSKRGGRLVFHQTKRAAILDGEEYYRTLNALSASEQTAPLVLDWVEQRLKRMDVPDYVWLAFYGVAAVLDYRTGRLTKELVDKLEIGIDSEERLDRKA